MPSGESVEVLWPHGYSFEWPHCSSPHKTIKTNDPLHSCNYSSRITGYCVTPSNYGPYPRIHRWENLSRRPVADLTGMMTSPTQYLGSVDWMTMCYFLEATLEVTSHASAQCPRQTIAAGLPAFVYLKRAGKQRLCLTASGQSAYNV
jgi:hypothetical protein